MIDYARVKASGEVTFSNPVFDNVNPTKLIKVDITFPRYDEYNGAKSYVTYTLERTHIIGHRDNIEQGLADANVQLAAETAKKDAMDELLADVQEYVSSLQI